jgi:hypothetical protein
LIAKIPGTAEALAGDARKPQHATAACIDRESNLHFILIESEQNINSAALDRTAERFESCPPHLGDDFPWREGASRRPSRRNRRN